jgi:RimJ/RimL family protein N-acetyltransferase
VTSNPEQDAWEVEIRPIEPDDKDALARGFERLSEQSRYRRFLSPRGPLSGAELRYFTEVDHHDHEALVAVDPVTGEGVGVARFVRSDDDPGSAEFAIAVVDDWHRRGVGSRLVAALADRAREEQITCFTALALAENEAMLSLLRELGQVRSQASGVGTVELAVDLPATGLDRLRRLLGAVARGEITVLPRRLRGLRSRSG